MSDDRTIDLRGSPMNLDGLKALTEVSKLRPDEFYVPESVWKEAIKMTPAEQDAAFRKAQQTQLESFIAWLRYYRAASPGHDDIAVRQTALGNMQTIVDAAQNHVEHGGGGDGSFTPETWVEARDLVTALLHAEAVFLDSGARFLVSRGHKL